MKYESRIELRVSKSMHAAWTMSAKKADQSLGDWIRSQCEDSIDRKRGLHLRACSGLPLSDCPPMKVYATLAPITEQVAAQSIRQAADLMRMEQAKKAGAGQPKKKGFCRGACERKTACPAGECKNA